ncbi:hypothetical protein C8Q80DRAFT_1357212 [Daedaleopsis nitida]|nr:hypothetical protein C8Q80DRAFT_1357212 [Daedaleopsis nitida]
MVNNAFLALLDHPGKPSIIPLAPYDDNQPLYRAIRASLAADDTADNLPASRAEWRTYVPHGGITHSGLSRETAASVRDWLVQHRDEEPVDAEDLMKRVLPAAAAAAQEPIVAIIVTDAFTMQNLDTLGTPYAQAITEHRTIAKNVNAHDRGKGLHLQKVAADNLYKTAWGKSWPFATQKTLLKSTVLGNIEILYDALLPPSPFPPVLVPLAEYESFISILTEQVQKKTKAYKRCGAAVLGQPGIGKSMFLLYLLLYRLERKLPTAVQFNTSHYVVFDGQGVRVNDVNDTDPRLKDCWALADSNASVIQPCQAFGTFARFIIQATSPKLERWKQWIKYFQPGAFEFYMDLPSVMEIAAIADECEYTPSLAYSYVLKWGPSIRTVLGLCEHGDSAEAKHATSLRTAAQEVCTNPSLVNVIRGRLFPHTLNRVTCVPPTNRVTEILEQEVVQLSNARRLQLFESFSAHSFTRTAAGWAHEMRMHHRLCTASSPLTFFRGAETKDVQPSTRLLAGVLSSMASVKASDAFYWVPSQSTFPGVDGLLGDSDGNLFAMQATVANDHKSPEEGLALLWDQFKAGVRKARKWHVVFFAPDHDTATRLLQKHAKLEDTKQLLEVPIMNMSDPPEFKLPYEFHPRAPATLVELRMMKLSTMVRAKPRWWEKIHDDNLVAKWRAEMIELDRTAIYKNWDDSRKEQEDYDEDEPTTKSWPTQPITVAQLDYVFHEPRYAASQRDEATGIHAAPVHAQHSNPSLTMRRTGIRDRTSKSSISFIPLYCLRIGESEILHRPETNGSSRVVIKKCTWDLYADARTDFESDAAADESISGDFQWLPTDFSVSATGEVECKSYINNLHPIEHKSLYPTITSVPRHFVPMFEKVLLDYLSPEPPLLIQVDPSDWYKHLPSQKEIEATGKDYWDWYSERIPLIPDPPPFKPPSTEGRTEPKYTGGSWHVEGMLNERIVATGIYYYACENITESRLAFRAQVGQSGDGDDMPYQQSDNRGYQIAFGFRGDEPMNQELGHVVAAEDKCVAFPNRWQHRVEPFALADTTRPGHRKILCFFLVDPFVRIHSTADVPPQQRDWYEAEMERIPALRALPQELFDMISRYVLDGTMTREDAEEVREELMEERANFVVTHNELVFGIQMNLCEH